MKKGTMEQKWRFDPMTGMGDADYAEGEFEQLKNCVGWGGVMVHLCTNEESCETKMQLAQILAAIVREEIYHIGDGYFLIYTDKAYSLGEKMAFFLRELVTPKRNFSIGVELFDSNEYDFSVYMKRIKRRVSACELTGRCQIVRDLPIK